MRPYWLAILFFVAWASASVRQRSREVWEPWQINVAGDAMGYYAYLPTLFTHGMRTGTMGQELRDRFTQFYCHVDDRRDRVVIQYTYVVALLELPFYCIAESIEGWGTTDGFTETHARLIAIAGSFYWTAGSLLLFLALQRWRPLKWWVALLVFIVGSFSTNLFFYAYRMPGFAHVYSFFLMGLALWAMLGDMEKEGARWKRLIFVIASALLVIARPLDLLAVVVLGVWYWSRVRGRGRWNELLLLQACVGLLLAFPQMLYWYDTHGSWIYYSYEGQGFSNWDKPEIRNVLLSPNNGLLPWSPGFLILPFGIWAMWKQERALCIALIVCFAALIYACASWWTWQFGCSFGQRSFAQYAALMMPVLWFTFGEVGSVPAWLKGLCVTALLLICRTWYFMALEYAGCYFGEETNWQPWAELFARAIK